eukprot:4681619-Amphidinium_carterae.2
MEPYRPMVNNTTSTSRVTKSPHHTPGNGTVLRAFDTSQRRTRTDAPFIKRTASLWMHKCRLLPNAGSGPLGCSNGNGCLQ